jgi:hypothetical protein
MSEPEPQTAPRPVRREKPLPLVLEILPGQAGEGLVDIYPPGTYEDKSPQELCDLSLKKTDWSLEEQIIIDDIRRQLDGGKLLFKRRELSGAAQDLAVGEVTEEGEEYLYLPIRAIKPQEGGGRCSFRFSVFGKNKKETA